MLWLEVYLFIPFKKVDAKAKTILETVSKITKPKKYVLQVFLRNWNWKSKQNRNRNLLSTPTQYKLNIMGNEQIFDGKKKVYNISKEDPSDDCSARMVQKKHFPYQLS